MEKQIKKDINNAVQGLIDNITTTSNYVGTPGIGVGSGTVTISTQCCTCMGSCNHTGPHSYCQLHGTASNAPNVNPGTPPLNLGLTGWKCPVCGTGVSPYATVCPNHNNGGNQLTFPFQWPNPNIFID